MKLTVIGRRRVDMETENVHGYSIYAYRPPLDNEAQCEGFLPEKIFIRDGSSVSMPSFVWGKDYEFVYEVTGVRRMSLVEILPYKKESVVA
ncbi:MAG: hypothetical protein LBN05_02870 [Oscillospiraceae bacterium]|jgi:hypothetical protein|nr:hypothetical protein [Oscillospiraceae bacterium]